MFLHVRTTFLSLLGLAACTTTDAPPPAPAAHRAAIERALPEIPLTGESALRLSLDQWMEALAIPGVSIAVIDDFEVVWAQGFGEADANTHAPMTPDTVLQAGSIAKPLAAMAALRMVEQGRLSLDDDFNQSLTSWRIPENEFTVEEHVTLRRLLSHTSAITPGGFDGYMPGAATPTIQQILNGEQPANSQAAQVMATPGTVMAYSGPAYTIVQLALTERSGRAFPELMRETIFAPLNMRNSTYEQPLPARFARHAASGHTWGGGVVEGRWRAHPEMAAAGLWTTPTDLAQVAIEMARARRGQSERVLSHEMAERMLTEERDSSALGWMLGSRGGMFWHNGGTQGYRASMRMYSQTGDGFVFLSNSDNGHDIMFALTNAVAAHWQWPEYEPRNLSPIVAAKLIASQRGVERGLAEYRAMRDSQPRRWFGPGDLNGWGYMLLEQRRIEDALRVFAENAGYYPDNAYAYDSLGEALLAAGRREEAIQNYRRSLELDPENNNAKDVLARIEAKAR
jgi:CubicO group peptidase (beta-lactamase class C family)